MINKNRLLSVIASLCFLLPISAYGQGWSFSIAPYVQFSNISGNAGIGRVSGADLDISFGDILEILDLGAMAHFEAHHSSGWGLSLDYGFMELSDDISGPLGGVAEVKVRQGVLQSEIMYRRAFGNGHVDFLGGIRWWDNDIEVTVDPAVLPGSATRKVNEDWVDVFVGARWKTPLSDSWKLFFRGDVGGFGLQADLTYSLAGGLQYDINDRFGLDLQYKGTWVDYEGGTEGEPSYFAYDTVTHGPLMSFIINF